MFWKINFLGKTITSSKTGTKRSKGLKTSDGGMSSWSWLQTLLSSMGYWRLCQDFLPSFGLVFLLGNKWLKFFDCILIFGVCFSISARSMETVVLDHNQNYDNMNTYSWCFLMYVTTLWIYLNPTKLCTIYFKIDSFSIYVICWIINKQTTCFKH